MITPLSHHTQQTEWRLDGSVAHGYLHRAEDVRAELRLEVVVPARVHLREAREGDVRRRVHRELRRVDPLPAERALAAWADARQRGIDDDLAAERVGEAAWPWAH